MLTLPLDVVILALDPARDTGFALGPAKAERPTIGTIKLSREMDDPADIFGRAIDWINITFAVNKPGVMVIELPVPPANVWGSTSFATTTILLGLFAIFTGTARAHKIPVIEAPIQTWRKYFIDRGRMKGDDAKRAAMKRCQMLGWYVQDHNSAEAAGIWAWGCSQIAPEALRRIEPLFAGRL